jgi:hypothetical protein
LAGLRRVDWLQGAIGLLTAHINRRRSRRL